jgi:hypothetical protein
MSVNGQTLDITRSDIDTVGDRFEVPGASRIVEDVLSAVDAWSEFATLAEVPRDMSAEISQHIGAWSSRLT